MLRFRFAAAAAFLLATGLAAAEVQTSNVEYKDGDTVLEGFLAYDDAIEGARPGILIIHQWTGVSDHEREVAKKLAKKGYVAFAADIYGKGIRPESGPDAAKVAGQYRTDGDRSDFRRRLNVGLEELKSNKRVDATKTAAIGYCFGGTGVLELARSGADVNGVISFHGGLDSPNPEDGKNIKAKVLVLHGADDPLIAKEDFDAFVKEMQDSGADWQFVMYGNAVHSFTDKDADSDAARYDETADRRSWRAMNDFFDYDVFGKEWKKTAMGDLKDPADWKREAKDEAADWRAKKPETADKKKPASRPATSDDSMGMN